MTRSVPSGRGVVGVALVLVAGVSSGCFASIVTGDAEPASSDPPTGPPDMARPSADLGAPPLDAAARDIGPADAGSPEAGPSDAGPPDLPVDMPLADPDLGPPIRPDLMRCARQLCLLVVVPESGTDGVSGSTFIELYFNRSIDSESGTVTLRVPGAPEQVLRGSDATTFAMISRDILVFRPDFFDEFEGELSGREGPVLAVRLTLRSPLPAGARVEIEVGDDWVTPMSGMRLEAASDPLAAGVFRVAE